MGLLANPRREQLACLVAGGKPPLEAYTVVYQPDHLTRTERQIAQSARWFVSQADVKNRIKELRENLSLGIVLDESRFLGELAESIEALRDSGLDGRKLADELKTITEAPGEKPEIKMAAQALRVRLYDVLARRGEAALRLVAKMIGPPDGRRTPAPDGPRVVSMTFNWGPEPDQPPAPLAETNQKALEHTPREAQR